MRHKPNGPPFQREAVPTPPESQQEALLMTVRRKHRNGERPRPSPKTLILIAASVLAFGVTFVVPVLGTPMIAATGIAALVASRKEE